MTKIRIRWGDLGSPTQPGNYRHGLDLVHVMIGDIKLAKGNPDAVFTAIRPDFYPTGHPISSPTLNFPTK
jgi:hypothetical protein